MLKSLLKLNLHNESFQNLNQIKLIFILYIFLFFSIIQAFIFLKNMLNISTIFFYIWNMVERWFVCLAGNSQFRPKATTKKVDKKGCRQRTNKKNDRIKSPLYGFVRSRVNRSTTPRCGPITKHLCKFSRVK